MIVVFAFHRFEHLTNSDLVEVDDKAVSPTGAWSAVDETLLDQGSQDLWKVVACGTDRFGDRRPVEGSLLFQHGKRSHAEIGSS